MKPKYKIVCRGEDLTDIYSERLLSLSLSDETEEKADSLKIDLEDSQNNIRVPEKGEVLEISLGYEYDLKRMGLFVIDTVQISGPPDRISISGKACPFEKSEQLLPLQTRKSRSFDDVTLGTIVNTVASEHGLISAISHDLARIFVSHIDQTNESDMNLLTRLARDYGAIVKPTFGRLVFAIKTAENNLVGASMFGGVIRKNECSQWEFELSKRSEFSGVATHYHDDQDAEDVEFVAGSDEKLYRPCYSYCSREEAQAAAKAKLRDFERGAQSFSISMPGRVDLVAGAKVTLLDFHPSVSGEWFLKKVDHSFKKKGGLTTKVEGEAKQ